MTIVDVIEVIVLCTTTIIFTAYMASVIGQKKGYEDGLKDGLKIGESRAKKEVKAGEEE